MTSATELALVRELSTRARFVQISANVFVVSSVFVGTLSMAAASANWRQYCRTEDQTHYRLGALELARDAQVSVVFGTDLLGTMQRHQLEELTIRSDVQSPLEIIRSATVNAAKLFNMGG